MAYYDKETYATADAVRIGRVHTFMPGKVNAGVHCIIRWSLPE